MMHGFLKELMEKIMVYQDSLEKYAREKLYMKKDNEDIYIIEFKE